MSSYLKKGKLALKATSKHFLRYLSYRREYFNSLFRPPLLDNNTLSSLVTITGEEDLLPWTLDSDYRKGGNSSCKARIEDNACKVYTVVFEGRLEFHRELEYEGELYAELKNDNLLSRKYKRYNMLRTSICTDGNPYKLSLILHSSFCPSHYYVMILDRSKDWVTLEIPLENFILQSSQNTMKQNLIIDSDTGILINMLQIGIYSPDKSEGNFKFSLKDISLVYREDANELPDVYPHHVMFKHQEDYNVAKYLDTGMSLIGLKK